MVIQRDISDGCFQVDLCLRFGLDLIRHAIGRALAGLACPRSAVTMPRSLMACLFLGAR